MQVPRYAQHNMGTSGDPVHILNGYTHTLNGYKHILNGCKDCRFICNQVGFVTTFPGLAMVGEDGMILIALCCAGH